MTNESSLASALAVFRRMEQDRIVTPPVTVLDGKVYPVRIDQLHGLIDLLREQNAGLEAEVGALRAKLTDLEEEIRVLGERDGS